MARVITQSTVLAAASLTAGIFLLLSTTLWYALEQPFTVGVSSALAWYCVLGLLNVAVLAATWYLLYSTYRHFVPRVRLLTMFVVWITLILAPQYCTEPSTIYYLRLLELPAFCLLGIALTYRVLHVFVPHMYHRWFTIASSLLTILLLATSSSALNVGWHTIGSGTVQFVAGPAYTIIVLVTFLLFFASILCIPLGRARYTTNPRLSVAPLTFITVKDGQDMNLIEALSQLIHDMRRRAFKRGQWVRYRNYTHTDRGIVCTKPKSCINALTTLFEYALHKNQSRSINVELLRDYTKEYLHCSIDYVVNTHAKTEFTPYIEHFSELGGHLTIKREGRSTKLIVTFPHQW